MIRTSSWIRDRPCLGRRSHRSCGTGRKGRCNLLFPASHTTKRKGKRNPRFTISPCFPNPRTTVEQATGSALGLSSYQMIRSRIEYESHLDDEGSHGRSPQSESLAAKPTSLLGRTSANVCVVLCPSTSTPDCSLLVLCCVQQHYCAACSGRM